MNDFTIYCTVAQTKKALKLGAPIATAEIDFSNTIKLQSKGNSEVQTKSSKKSNGTGFMFKSILS